MKKRLIRQRLYLAMLIFGAFALREGRAAIVPVTTTADSGPGSLRDAIAASVAGGTIEFHIPTSDFGYNSAAGVFTITLSGGALLVVRDLTITGPTNTKIAITGNSLTRVFNIPAPEVASITTAPSAPQTAPFP